MFHIRPARSSMRSCTTAHGRRPVRGSTSPTGLSGPKRSVSRPRRAISSTGMHPSKYGTSSKACADARSAATSASRNASYSSRVIGQLRYAPSPPAPSIVSRPHRDARNATAGSIESAASTGAMAS